ncbi:hypothetical protein [Microbacterium sp. CPCC 204701]|uniref:hypothetical protein n=1 Tax=Microbacterium sp. CPCC 204701 TaxID=2493084 RepID=UPI000FD9501B|nr:hypothetical protein [Microbacterium sp. CPCC 204701]
MTTPIVDLDRLEIAGVEYVPADPPGPFPATDGWMHSGCALLEDDTVVVAHPQGRRLLFFDSRGTVRTIDVPVLEMHTIVREDGADGETLWLVNNGHRFEPDHPDYAHHRERGSVVRVDLDGQVVQELSCPDIAAYASTHWQPTSICRAAEGSLWVADGYETSLVHQYVDGTYRRTVDGSETGTRFDTPHGLAARNDQVLVADRTNRRIVVLEDGVASAVLDAPLTSPSSLLVLGDWLLVTELFGGLAIFEGDRYVGHYARSRQSPTRDAWPNDRDERGGMKRPRLDGALHSPHGLAGDSQRLVVTEWLIGGRVDQFRASRAD